jgi:hypothetical protein
MQNRFFASLTGKKTCLFLSHSHANFRKKSFYNNALVKSLRLGPVLDNSLRPGPSRRRNWKDGR